MAFDRNNFSQASVADGHTPKIWCYRSADDSLTAIAGSAYFDEVSSFLTDGDLIYVVSTASSQEDFLKVTSAAIPVTTARLYAGAEGYKVLYAGTHITTGGSAQETITIADAAPADIVFTQLRVEGATPRTILLAQANEGEMIVTFDGDPSTDHELYYQGLRVAS